MSDLSHVMPAIVVVAYNRPIALTQILWSISRAQFTGYDNIPLVISIDKSDDETVTQIAESFIWGYGTKRIIKHESRLGLRNHILACGDLTSEYHAVIVLEDDLYVSPVFYDYAVQAMRYFGEDEAISGISLYAYDVNEHAIVRFCAIDDGNHNYFLQSASSWGQLWTRRQWDGFRHWYAENADKGVTADDPLPRNVISWKETSWKKYFIKYMVLEHKYFAYPRLSLTSGIGDVGTHTRQEFYNLRVPLALQSRQYEFCSLVDSSCIYDCFFELEARCAKRHNSALAEYDFELDLYGIKSPEKVRCAYLLSIRECENPVFSYSMKHIPFDLNIVLDLKGNFFHLGRVEDFGAIPAEKQLACVKALQKDLGWRIYGKLFLSGLLNRLSQLITS